MINHNIPTLSLVDNDEGETFLPSEEGSISFESNLRQFIILSRRLFAEEVIENCLADTEGIKQRKHSDNDEYNTYFGLHLRFKNKVGSLEDFVEDEGDDFFDSLSKAVTTSNIRGISGHRGAFVREFRRVNDPYLGEVMETKILVSTSVFYNDYRVTTGFPSDISELEDVTEEIFNKLEQIWGDDLQLEITPILVPSEENTF